MMQTRNIAVLALLASTLLAPAQAATVTGGTGSSYHCTTYNLAKIIGVINAGTEELCIIFDDDTPLGTGPYVRLRASGPDNALGVAFTQTWSILAGTTTGCTTGTLTQTNGASAATSWANAYFPITFNAGSRQCAGMAQYTLVVATVPILTWQGGWDTDAQSDASYSFTCDHTGTTTNAQDPNAATCNTLAQTNTISGTINTILSGVLDTLNRQCAASATGTACNLPPDYSEIHNFASAEYVHYCTPKQFVPNGSLGSTSPTGFFMACIDYNPTLTPDQTQPVINLHFFYPTGSGGPSATGSNLFAGTGCTQVSGTITWQGDQISPLESSQYGQFSPTITGTNCQGQVSITSTTSSGMKWVLPFKLQAAASTTTLSGTLNTVLSGSINVATTGTLTLSGTMNAVISGTLDVLDRLCAAAPTGTTCTVATINTNANTTFTQNGNNTFGFPSTLHLCGAPSTTDPCPAIATASTAAFGADGLLDVFILAAIGAWLWAASQLMPVRILGIIIEFYAGFRALTMRPQPYGHNTVAILFFLIAAIFALHMAISKLKEEINKRKPTPDPIEGDPA